MNAAVTLPVIRLPRRIDRPVRLGPFPSARHALKFVAYAGTGAVVAGFLGALLWLPFVGVGLLVSLARDGKALDERAGDYLRFRWRTLGANASTSNHRVTEGREVVRLENGRIIAVLSAHGVPTTFLPPEESRRLFDGYRAALRGLDGGALIVSHLEPLAPISLGPPSAETLVPGERDARAGYAEMVEVICRRRSVRRVLIVLWSDHPGPPGRSRLEGRVSALLGALEALDVAPTRLRGRELESAIRRLGWTGPAGGR